MRGEVESMTQAHHSLSVHLRCSDLDWPDRALLFTNHCMNAALLHPSETRTTARDSQSDDGRFFMKLRTAIRATFD